MPKLRLPIRSHRGGPWLALGVVAAILAVPGVARAQTPSLPVTPAQVGTALPGAPPACSRIVADDLTKLFTDLATPPAQLPTSLDDVLAALTKALGRPPTAAELVAVLEGLSPGALGGSTGTDTGTGAQSDTNGSSALTGVTDNLPGGTGVTNPLTGSTDGTSDAGGGASADAVTPNDQSDVPGDLQQLAEDFVQFCIPSPPPLPSPPTPPSSSSGGQPQTGTQPVTQPETQPQTQPTTQPTTQPVSYPGYAATGGIATTVVRPAGDQRPSDTVPLSVVCGIVLASAATAAGVRSRVRRDGR